MKRQVIHALSIAALTLTAGQAFATCSDELARLTPGTTTGSVTGEPATGGRIAKDGSNAPLQTGAGSAQSTAQANRPASGQGGIAKDGQTMPLAGAPGGGANVATSGQDAQAQQRPNQPASTSDNRAAAPTSHSPAMMAALDRARSMHQQGNEAGCMDAVNEAKRLQ
ncbi:hypothetical protein [Salinarimonas soli]|uniref:hypothetical protein n=1 Tax=Salinarimonas soli TaxID=1638099 RepID=UPI001F0B2E0D|nr:hypothetical protein [Salinarimonas soli]